MERNLLDTFKDISFCQMINLYYFTYTSMHVVTKYILKENLRIYFKDFGANT